MADVLASDDEPRRKIPGSHQEIPANEPKMEGVGIEPLGG
jgi:hypothetical protein